MLRYRCDQPDIGRIQNLTIHITAIRYSEDAYTDPDAAWLETLKQSALRKTSGWRLIIDAFLQGLATAGQISDIELKDLRTTASLCTDSDATWSEILYFMMWTAWVATITIGFRSLSINWWFVTKILVLTALAGVIWALHRTWLKPGNYPKQHAWDRWFVIIASVLLVPIFTVCITLLVGLAMQTSSIHRFTQDRLSLSKDPQGFPMLRTFARKNYDVDVVLGDVDDSWASTTVYLPGASPASMSLKQGFCELNMYRDNVFQNFAPIGKLNKALWLHGVMMHEFGHCLDTRRDMPRYGKAYSIAPIDAKGVNDVQTYVAAEEQDTTKLWREALADMFAVGYWRLVAPNEAASLTASLRQNRNNAKDDTTHATMCWIDQALRAPVPASEKDLFAWADHQRNIAQCVISKADKKISLF